MVIALADDLLTHRTMQYQAARQYPGTRKGLRGEGLNEETDARARRVTQECGHAAEADALDELLL